MAENEEKIEMSEELAREDLKQWADANDIDLFVKGPNGEKLFDAGAERLVKAIMSGRLVLVDGKDFEYTVSDKSPAGFAGKKLTLKAPYGAGYMAMDKFKEQEGIHKTVAMLSAITGQDEAFFARVFNTDFKILSAIASFFIAG